MLFWVLFAVLGPFYLSPYMRDAILGPIWKSLHEGCHFGFPILESLYENAFRSFFCVLV